MRLHISSFLFWMLLGAACGDDAGTDASLDAGADATTDASLVTAPNIPWLVEGAPPFEWTCPSGWQVAGDEPLTHCTPFADSGPATCPAGQAHFVGEPGCRSIGSPCPAGDFAADLPSDGTVIYVSASAAPGGDGTLAAPYSRLSEVPWLSSGSGTTVALAKGRYEGSLPLRPGVTVIGACANETILTGTVPVVLSVIDVSSVGEPATVRDLSIVDPLQRGVHVRAGGHARLEGVVISGAAVRGAFVEGTGSELTLSDAVIRETRPPNTGFPGAGVLVVRGGRIAAQRLVLEDNAETGIFVTGDGSVGVIEDVSVTRTRPPTRTDAEGATGRGLDVELSATLMASRVYLGRNHGAGIFVWGLNASAELTDVVVADTQLVSASRPFANGISVKEEARLSGQRIAITTSMDTGLTVGDSSDAELSDVIVLDTQPNLDGQGGSAVFVFGGSRLTLTRFAGARSHGAGLFLIGAGLSGSGELEAATSEVTLTDTLVRDTLASDERGAAHGVVVLGGAQTDATRLVVEASREVGVVVAESGSELTLADVVVRDTLPLAGDAAGGYGILAAYDATLEGARVAVESSSSVGVFSSVRGRATFRDLRVTDVVRTECGMGGCIGLPGGYGVASTAFMSIERFAIENAEVCGVYVADEGTAPEVDLMSGVVSGSAIGVCVQAPDYDIARLSDGVMYSDNGTNIDTSSTLPTPPIPSF